MDNSVAYYVDQLNHDINEKDAISAIVLLHDVLNAEFEKKELNFEILFKNEEKGIVSYLRTLITNSNISKELTDELENLLRCIVVDFTDVAAKYMLSLVEKFLGPAIMNSQNLYLRKMAYEMLLLVMKTPGIPCFRQDWLDTFYGQLIDFKVEKSTSSTDKGFTYQLLGEIIDYSPGMIKAKQIFNLLVEHMRKQIHYSKDERSTVFRVVEMEALFNCLQLFLKHFHGEDCVKENSQKLYGFVKEGCGMSLHRRTSIRAALKIFQFHFDLFANYVFVDYVWWIELLTTYLKSTNKDDQLAAFHAFSTFYRGISKVLKQKPDQKDALKKFIEILQNSLRTGSAYEVSLAAQNFGHFAKVCRIHEEKEELRRMLALTSQIAENCCSGLMEDNIEAHHMSSLLVSMSKIIQNLYDENSYEDEFSIVEKFSAFVIISYPKVPNKFRYLVKNDLIKAFITYGRISDTVLRSYLEKLMFTSLIKCCSCPLERDIEYLNSLGDSKNSDLISCNEYVPLWQAICNVEKELIEHKIVSEKTKFETIREKKLPSKVFDTFIKSVLSILAKLDFSVIEDDGSSNDEVVIIDDYGLKPTLESDFYIFINLVELFSAAVDVCESNVLEKWIPELVRVFIKLSASSSIKSGFFQLFAVIFQRGKSQKLYETVLLELKSFVTETVINVRKLKGVDLRSCLLMILKVPLNIVETIRAYIALILQVVFTQGLEDLSLARCGLESLQTWKNYFEPEKFRPILETVVPLLNSYLQSKKSIGDTDTLSKYEERLLTPAITSKNKIYKKFRNMNTNSSSADLLKLQREILVFLSEIDVDLCRTIYNPEKHSTNEFTEVLRFNVPFRDKNVKIFLDKFLPRIIELTHHNNLKTRTAACEMLHSMTVVFLGNIATNHLEKELSKPVESLFRQLVTCILKLGCEDDVALKLMFTQLSHQLVRYYSRAYRSNVSALVLDILFDNVSHVHDISLRHFSAGVIREFVCGSLKDGSGVGSSTHILAVMKYICLYCVQPCPIKRQGAALAFNSIHREVERKSSVISTYWLELLINFLKNSSLNVDDEYDDVETSQALQHIRRILLEKPELFLQSNSSRRVPKCLKEDGGTLNSVIAWMLGHCTSGNKLCRNNCMRLIVDLCCKLPGIDSLEKFFCYHTAEEEDIYRRIFACISLSENLRNVDSIRSRGDELYVTEFAMRTVKWLRSLLARLHCLWWLLKEEITYFSSSTSDHRFSASMKFYCEYILPNNLDEFMSERGDRVKREFIPANLRAVYETLKYEVFNEYLKILTICNVTHFHEFIGSERWLNNFWQSSISYLFDPATFATNSSTHECLRNAIPRILSRLGETSADKRDLIYEKIRRDPSHSWFDDFIENIENCHFVSLYEKKYISALNELQQASVIAHIFPDVKERKQRIWNSLFRYVRSGSRAKSCNPTIVGQLEGLLAFALTDCEVNFVLELLATSSPLVVNNAVSANISHGRYFFITFKKPIAEFLSLHQPQVVAHYLGPTARPTKEGLSIVIECLKFFAESPKPINSDELIEGVLKNWPLLTSCYPGDEGAQYLFHLIEAMVVKREALEKFRTEEKRLVFSWLMNTLLTNEKRFSTGGKEYFNSLTPFLSSPNEANDASLLNALKSFHDKYFEASSPTKLADAEYVNMFKALLSLFCNSENIAVLKSVVTVGVFHAHEECDLCIQQTLENVMSKASVEKQLQLLNTVYEFFNDASRTADFRLGCVKKFLVPLFYASKLGTLKTFFVAEMKNIFEMLKRPINEAQESNSEKETITLVTAAVCVVESYMDLENEDTRQALSLEGFEGLTLRKKIFSLVVSEINLKDKSNASALRVLRCYCYNTLIKWLLKVVREAKHYANIFSENPNRRCFIWQSIIDSSEEIDLKMFIDEIPARQKALKQKRKELKTKNMGGTTMRSIPTQYLSTSSLVTSVKYDMSEWNVSNAGYIMESEKKSYTIDLEEDKLNNHECMATVCELIRFMVAEDVSPLPDPEIEPNPEPPKWMESLRHSLKFALDRRRKNMILFFLKMIHNCETIFCPYAKSWIDLIISCLLMLKNVNYLTFDVIVMIITWCKVHVPTDRMKNNNLLAFILENIKEEKNTTMKNHKLELVRTFIKHWYQVVDVPYNRVSSVNDRAVKADTLEVSLTIAKAFLLRGFLPFIDEDRAAREFSRALLLHVDRDAKDVNRSLKVLNFEVLALILEVAKTKNVLMTCRQSLEDDLVRKLDSLKLDNTQTKTELFFSCLDHTLMCYPSVLRNFLPYLVHHFDKFQGKIKAQCLHMMTLVSDVLDDTLSQLTSKQYTKCLCDSNHEIVKNTLILLKKIIQTLSADDILPILPDIVRLSSHATSECRQLVYEIADTVYQNYRHDNSDELSRIKSQCKVILLNGLLDGDRALQEKMFKSWKMRCNFSDQTVERFISIVTEMYTPENESHFVNYAADFLLDASSETPEFESKIFDNPLDSSSTDFRDQDFTSLSLLRNRHSIAPIFMNSLSNQLVSLSLTSAKPRTLVLPGSQQRLFFHSSQNTQHSSELTGASNSRQWNADSYASLKNYSLDEPELRKLRNRLQSSEMATSKFHAIRNAQKREKRIELLRTRSDRAERSVQFSRQYKDGEFPDIEIPRSAVVNPLRKLGKKDPVIARLIFISLFDGLLRNDSRKKDRLKAIGDGFNQILKRTLHHNNVLMETILETVFFHSTDIHLESQRVVISSHVSGLLSLGSLILENSLLSEMHPTSTSAAAKRIKVDESVLNTKWVQLADLYKALDQNDVVNGILKEKIKGPATNCLREGLNFEQIGNWEKAGEVYKKQIPQGSFSRTRSFEEHFIFDAYLKCAANLSQWSEVQNIITDRFPNLDSLWNESWDTEHTLPWYFTAEAILCAKTDDPSDALEQYLKKWMGSVERSTILNNLITEPMAILLFLNGEHFEAEHKVRKSVESMLQNWNHSTASLDKFYTLLTLSEIDSMLAPYSNLPEDGTLPVDACSRVLNMWESNTPRCDNLYWWDKRIEYRRLFSSKYLRKLDEECVAMSDRLKIFKTQSCLQMADVALRLQNEEVAIKYAVDAKMEMEKGSTTTNVEAQGTLTLSRVYLSRAKKLHRSSQYVKCLETISSYTWNEKLSYAYHMHLANTLRELQNDWSSHESNEKRQMIELLREILNKPDIVADTARIEMREAVKDHYEKASSFAEKSVLPSADTAAAYLSLAKYSKELRALSENDENEGLIHTENYIRCILRALKFDSREAQLLFPKLLQVGQITHETLQSVFVSEAALVEEWKFLIWIQQLLAHIDTDKLPVIEKLLLNIIEKYPNAIQFSLFSSDLMQHKYQNDAAQQLTKRLREILNRNSAIADFVRAVSCVQLPEMYFYTYMKKLSAALREDNVSRVVSIKREMFSDGAPFRGKAHTESKWWEIFRKLLADIEDQSSMTSSRQSEVDSYVDQLRVEATKIREPGILGSRDEYKFLRNYSCWFDSFSELQLTNIEIPGQYDGFAPPNPDRHVRIFEFDRSVQIQQSVQVPIKIQVTGDDAKKYSYLVKFGEDTRQDQRIQQIFSIMNRCSMADSEASGSGGNVSVITYGVFPLTTYFGIIEWLERTTSLRDFMYYQLSESEKRKNNVEMNRIREEYNKNIYKYDPSNLHSAHEEAVVNFSKDVIVTTFERLRDKIPQDVFRKSILAMCNSPIMYWNLRNQFITSYSTMCMYGWILGIGDRHLSNFLVCLKTSRCIGIDFGHAFGTGTTCLEIPELIPFRMTPHIVDIMQPFGLTGLIRETMVGALKIILKNEDILFAAMQIFILDPSFNWLKSIKKRRQERTGIDEMKDPQWYPSRQIERIRCKLRGKNPTKILEEEVQENSVISMRYANGCIKLLNRENSWRSRMPIDNLSLVEQVDTLLDIATDKCILAVSYSGLETYI